MKRKFGLMILMITLVFIAACGNKPQANSDAPSPSASQPAAAPSSSAAPSAEPVTLKVGASPVPHAEILHFVKEKLAAEGVNLEVVEFTDYVQPNVQVYEKQLDANFFQHVPYLESFNAEKGYNLVKVNGVHIEPIGAYSKKIAKVEELKEGAKVAIPNDATNGGRALALLEKNGLIKLTEGKGINGTVQDIVENPKKLEIVELEAATLPRVLPDVDLAVINTNYALEADLVPTKDALLIEDKESPYVNILVSRPDNQNDEAIQKLAAALNTPEVKQFIEEKYKGAVVPAF